MRTVRYDKPIILLVLGLCFQPFVTTQITAAPPEIKVRKIEPVLRDGGLYINIQVDDLFTKKVVGTIQSGLSSVISVDIRVLANGKREILQKSVLQRISYNIWEERYTITTDSLERKLTDFNRVQELGSRIDDIFLAHESRLDSGIKYVIKVRASISPISSLQSQKLDSWLQESDGTQSEIVSSERSSGFKFNLSNLVSFLVGGNKRRGNNSREETIEFRLADIRKE